jgi:hypothetical protein
LISWATIKCLRKMLGVYYSIHDFYSELLGCQEVWYLSQYSDQGSVPSKGTWFFPFSTAFRLVLGPTQPDFQWNLGALWVHFEADYSSPCSAEVKNAWSYTSTLTYFFMVWYLIKHSAVLYLIYIRHEKCHTFIMICFLWPLRKIMED